MGEIVFGIDLGTTYSCVAYMNDVGKPETIRNVEGDVTTPSVVWFDSETSQVVGTDAKQYAITDPANAVSFIKREMGTKFRRKIYGTDYSPEELSAKILTKLVQDANNSLKEKCIIKDGEEIKKAVITCPAYFGMEEKNATKLAGELAGLEVLDIINEPTAAAINYGAISGTEGESQRILVYDLGGGTFDVTVIDVDGNKIDVVCTGGDPRLGGKDWDEATVAYLTEKWREDKNDDSDITDNLQTKSSLMEAAEKAKKSLSTKEKTIVNISHEGNTDRVELTRQKFDEYTEILLMKTIDLTNLCIEEMKKKNAKPIDRIILVGGSSYMPQIKKKLESQYGLAIDVFDPNEAVAKGAAIYAQNIDKYSKDVFEDHDGLLPPIIIHDVSSRTYGIYCLDSQTHQPMISNFIVQNDKLPAENIRVFNTNSDGQEGAEIGLYETIGQVKEIRDINQVNELKPVTTFDMKLKQPVPKGTPIEIKMTLNNSGLISIHAVEKATGSELDATYTVENTLRDDEMEEAKKRALVSDVQ